MSSSGNAVRGHQGGISPPNLTLQVNTMVIMRIYKKNDGELITHEDASTIVTTMVNSYIEVEAVEIKEGHVTLFMDGDTSLDAVAEFRKQIAIDMEYICYLELNY